MSEPDIRLLVTDLDGTLIGHRDERAHYPQFRELIADLRRTSHTTWLVCTGRHYGSFRRFFGSMAKADVRPDLVSTRNGFMYRRHGEHYFILPLRSLTMLLHIFLAHQDARRRLKRMHGYLQRTWRGVRRLVRLPDRFSLRFESEEAAAEALAWVVKETKDQPALYVEQKGREIEVRAVPCRKGVVVRALAERLGVARDHVLTVGDSNGDVCMLDRRVAFHTGCPLTDDRAVLASVHRTGGHISRRYTLAGVMDVIQATRSGTVSSELPGEVEMPRRRRTRHSDGRAKLRHGTPPVRSVILLGSVGAITMVVCASFGILPFSGLIMKPVNLFFRLIAELIGLSI